MAEEFYPSRTASLEDRLRHLENWAALFSGRMSTNPTQEEGAAGFLIDSGAAATAVPVFIPELFVTTVPDSSSRNVVQATNTATIPITLKLFSGSTVPLLETQNASGGTTGYFRVLSTGLPSCQGELASANSLRYGDGALASAAGCVAIGAPAYAQLSQSTCVGSNSNSNSTNCVLVGYSATSAFSCDGAVAIGMGARASFPSIVIGREMSSSASGQCVIGDLGTAISNVYIGKRPVNTAGGGTLIDVTIQPSGATGNNTAGVALVLAGAKGTGNAAGGDIVFKTSDAEASGTTLQTLREKWRIVNNTGEWRASLLSSTTVREVFSILPSYVVSTDASRTARAVLAVSDYNGERECIRLECDGSAAMIGFLGASAVVRPSSTTDLRQALIDLGLYTTGGATPLNLNGGDLTVNAATINADSTLADGVDLSLGTTNGTKIGTATNQLIGFYNATPVVQPSAYTQTYSTADKTHANPTATTLTDNSGGSADTTLEAISAGYVQSEVANNFADLAASNNALIADLADLKQLVNSVIDDLQQLGLVG